MIIQKNLKTHVVARESSIKECLQRLDKNGLRFLLCVDEKGHLCGTLTAGDVNRWLISDSAHSLDISVSNIYNSNFQFLSIEASTLEISNKLKLVAYVPLVDSELRPVALAMRRHLHKGLSICNRQIGREHPVFVIAEIGNNHNGSLEMAKRLIDNAYTAGADCAKFQMRDLDSLYANSGNSADARENLGSQYTLDLLNRFQLSIDEMYQAFDYCKEVGIIPLCTPWDEISVARLEEYGMPGYKVASADLTNHALFNVLADTGKPLICSTGMSQESEIKETVNLLQNQGIEYALLHCNSTYPAPFKDIHLNYLNRLREIGQCEVGYSGHERDIFVSVAAVSKSACIIEKHLTLDRNMEGNDHKVSLLPEEFQRMVVGIRQVEQSLGRGDVRSLSQGEMMNRVTLSKSVFINCDLTKGTKIESGMLVVKSPGHGLQPNRLKELIGMPAPNNMASGDVFYPSDLEQQKSMPRDYSFTTRWGLPVRHHDYESLLQLSNLKVLEFHLSYKDLELDRNIYFKKNISADLVIHAPELFAGDHTLDLASSDTDYRKRSIREMRRVVEFTKELSFHFQNFNHPIGIITNVGGFSQDAPLSSKENAKSLALLRESLTELSDSHVQIWPQTMPPFPWHFGGQRFHNLFVDADEIVEFCKELKMRICLDVSHSKLACNQRKQSFQLFLEKVLPFTAHLHIADSQGVDGEGLQIGSGEIDFYALGEAMQQYAPQASWIPEVWQGHENKGEGFWYALESLEKQNVY